ncbi:prepilin-type N-terminal cleavage/methylation domain-containing protein [Litorilituus sediminis]|uniref:Prepilin-type N-terminal cleavage/methylation domain-containing protein n=1 Tax=Litorilituus sediminis TaxID=718192 RepID=A0A4P6P2G0_9GAMM|nr:prepilin-type N-terminal cleavage/methylation domain-containing protein [Litorilituus sediminis]QBG35304.1 prepilin-type N-terminal cleavage/methylation domain-containing protein [Litorilituus sediminis]
MMYRSSKGFTLVELLIVLVLIGLSSAIVLPSMWQQFDQVRYRSEIAKVKSMVNYCRHFSFYQSQALIVSFHENQLNVTRKADGEILRTIQFDTFTFAPRIVHFEKRGNITKLTLALIKNKQEMQVELHV